jgi:hypothetical protein
MKVVNTTILVVVPIPLINQAALILLVRPLVEATIDCIKRSIIARTYHAHPTPLQEFKQMAMATSIETIEHEMMIIPLQTLDILMIIRIALPPLHPHTHLIMKETGTYYPQAI